MKKSTILLLVGLILFSAFSISLISKQTEPWKKEQLLAPNILADMIARNDSTLPLIISIGPAGPIKGSLEIGPASEDENIVKLKQLLAKQPKNRHIVIYCGCCPFKNCPNVRPAFSLLNEMQFTRHQLLDLSTNLKTDWLDKGYPINP